MEKTVIALGFFDGVHKGHKKILETAAEYALKNGLKSAACTFAVHPRSIVRDKAPCMLTDIKTRCGLMKESGAEDIIIIDFDEKTAAMSPDDFIELLKKEHGCAAIVCGDDFRFGKGASGVPADFEAHGVKAVVCEKVRIGENTVSSTYIRELLKDGEAEKAKEALGRAYFLCGTVAHGRGVGHTIGYPTFNLECESGILVPKNGVYATVTGLCGKDYISVTNIGTRPTFGECEKATVETHIPGFSGDIYGAHARVSFIKRLRGEKRFEDISALCGQIELDIESAQKAYKEENG